MRVPDTLATTHRSTGGRIPAGWRAAPANLFWRSARVVRSHVSIVVVVAVYCAIGYGISYTRGEELAVPWRLEVMLPMAAALALFGLAAHMLYVTIVLRPARPLRRVLTDLATTLTFERAMGAILVVGLFRLHAGAFGIYKRMIADIQPHGWDAQFASWDKTLHFGIQPWEWLQMLTTAPTATWLIDRLYLSWFYAVACGVLWYALADQASPRRKRFIWSYLASWLLLGNLLATAFASMGPCY